MDVGAALAETVPAAETAGSLSRVVLAALLDGGATGTASSSRAFPQVAHAGVPRDAYASHLAQTMPISSSKARRAYQNSVKDGEAPARVQEALAPEPKD